MHRELIRPSQNGVLFIFGGPCQHRLLVGQEHCWIISLAVIGSQPLTCGVLVLIGRHRGSTPAGFAGARRADKFLNVCFHQVEPNIPIKLLASLV
jgi:hypothetical protein